MLPKALYVINYHQVSWEESAFFRGSGMVTLPNIFREHIKWFLSSGEILSLADGIQALQTNKLSGPTFCITFDDGYRDVVRYAVPILEEYGAPFCFSLISDALARREFFWRLELYLLRALGLLPELKKSLEAYGYADEAVRVWTSHNFSVEIREIIRELYEKHCPPHVQQAGWEAFLTIEQCKELARSAPVTFLNHSRRHYYYGVLPADEAAEDIVDADKELRELFEGNYSGDFVVPFGGPKSFNKEICSGYRARHKHGLILAHDSRANLSENFDANYVSRFPADNLSLSKLQAALAEGVTRGRLATTW